MVKPRLTQEMKKYTLTASLAAGHPGSGIATFLKVVRPFVLKLRRELEAARDYVSKVSNARWYCWQCDIITTLELYHRVQATIARKLQVEEATI